MPRDFTTLTKADFEEMRKRDAIVKNKNTGIYYDITAGEIDAAILQLKGIYLCNISRPFATKLLLINLLS